MDISGNGLCVGVCRHDCAQYGNHCASGGGGGRVGECDAAVPPNCTGNNTSTAEVGVWAATVAKRANPPSGTTVAPGQIMLYTLTVTVTGAGATTSPLEVVDTLGPGLTYLFLTNRGLFTVQDEGNGVLRFTLPAGRSAGTYAVTYRADVDLAVVDGATVNNSVTGLPCTTSHTVQDLIVSKVLTADGNNNGIADPGELLTYTVTVSNPGQAALTDVLGAGLTFRSASIRRKQCRLARYAWRRPRLQRVGPARAHLLGQRRRELSWWCDGRQSDKYRRRGDPGAACGRWPGRDDAVRCHGQWAPMSPA